MSTGIDLGEIGDLAKAIGLTDESGSIRSGWLSNPGNYLSSVLGDDTQRNALIDFVDQILAIDREADADGLIWLQIAENQDPHVTVYVVIDPTPSDYVAIGAGVRVISSNPDSDSSTYVPIFRAAKTGHSIPDPILIGQSPDAVIRISTEITVASGPPLGGVALQLKIPTASGVSPQFALSLKGLQLPGATAPQDITVSASDVSQLEQSAINLVLGLVKAQADALGAGQLTSLIGLIGLDSGGPIPHLPLEQLTSQGVAAIATWFESVMSDASARTAWMGNLASLLGGAASGDEVTFSVGPAQVSIGVDVTSGSGGHPVVTPILAVGVTQGDFRARIEADLLRLDLATMSVTALPSLAAFAQCGKRADGGSQLLTGDPQVDCVRVGITLDQARKPNFLLAADTVTIAGHLYPTLDLSTPDAIAQSATTVLGDVVSSLIAKLGPIGDAVKLLLGLSAPPSAPGATLLDIASFLHDPLVAVRSYWRGLLHDHPEAITDLLISLRDLISDAGQGSVAISGSGNEADFWRLPIVGPFGLDAWRSSGGDVLDVALSADYVADNLGHRCTRVESKISVGLVTLDLAAGSATFLPSVDASLAARARGGTSAIIALGPMQLTADSVGLAVQWKPGQGISANVVAPNLAVQVDDFNVPLVFPAIAADGSVSLDPAGWDALEQLLGMLASAAPLPWIEELAKALGWNQRGSCPHLRLADLAADATSAIKNWLVQLAIDEESTLLAGLNSLARLLTGSIAVSGRVTGQGTDVDPWRIPLLPLDSTPELTAWLLPDGPGLTVSTAPEVLQSWGPGDEGLSPAGLAQALADESVSSPDLRDLLSGRGDLGLGFSLLLDRWTSTDGRIVPPDTDPVGVTVHLVANTALRDLEGAVSLGDLFNSEPATVVHVAVVRPVDALPWADAPTDRVIDLRAPYLPPESFPLPMAATGEWFIALARRCDARLASGDTDGTVGQAARIVRVLSSFSGLAGGVVLHAFSEAGHAALAAANNLAFIDSVITVGTPFSAVAFTILDDQPAADAFRLLRVLLPLIDPNEPDDQDLNYGRGLVEALGALLPLGDPGADIRPAAVAFAPRAGLAVHAYFGIASEAAVRAGMTAIVAAGLSTRAMARASQPQAVPTGARLGLRTSVTPGTDGITVSGFGQVELCGVDVAAGVPSLSSPALAVHLEVRRVGGWLVGGPGTGLGAGDRPAQAVRWLEANLHLPFSSAEASAEIILHEPSVFGIEPERWIVRPDAATVATAEIVTPALPEIRALIASIVEQLSLPASATPAVNALLSLLQALDLVASTGGAVADAIEHLLHDPAVHMQTALADAARQSAIATSLTQLLAGLPGITLDLANRRLVLDTSGSPADVGMMNWTAHVEAGADGKLNAAITLGSAGNTAAGGALLRIQTGPFRATLEWHRPGLASPELIQLWPSPDAAAVARVLALLVPAECARLGLEYLRGLDDTAKPIIDVALDAIGLLSPGPADQRNVLLPLGLFHDPAGWFSHASSLGAGGGFSGPRVAALLDALKPIVGISGGPGEWDLATGVTAIADSEDGNLRLGLHVDTSQLTPIATATGRLISTGAFLLTIPPNAAPKPAVTLSIGLDGAAPGRRAVYVELSDHVRVYLRPDTGADLSLYPDPPGLADLASTAVTQALPFVLDALASQTGTTLEGRVGEIVRAVGDGLNLRSGAPAKFDGAKLKAWATDPVASLIAALPTLTNTALNAITTALGPALPAAVSATVTAGNLVVSAAGGVSLTWRPSPLQFTVNGTVTGIPGVDRVQATIVLDSTGLQSLTAKVGPCPISAGPVTIRPYIEVVAGVSPSGGRRVDLGLALDSAGTELVAGRWNIDGAGFGLIAVDGTNIYQDPVHVALQLVEAVLDLVAAFAINTDAVQQLLGETVGSSTVRGIMNGVVLQGGGPPDQLAANLFDPAQLLTRIQHLAGNLAAANPSISIGGGFTIGLSKAGSIVQITLGVNGRIPLTSGDVVVSIEADSRWIQGQPAAGIAVGILDVDALTFAPSLSANGIGVRISKSSGPLLDLGLSLGSVAVHLYGEVAPGSISGGVQLQLSDLAVGVSGAQGGNPIARGLMGDSGSGKDGLAPSFSPALAVQKHNGGPVLVSVSAGDGDGPWWLVIQKGFGPIYIEQVGFGVTVEQDQLKTISLLLDGRVSLFGLTAAVDELQLTFVVASDASLFDPSRWAIDLAGLAISADMAGITLEGGLRKFGDGDNVEYVGMLLARFAVYGLSVYGGYGSAVVDGQRFSAFFAFGAINGPIGGPPAFFLTGIGGGFGINRDLIFPSDLSRFGDFPFLKALDPAAQPSDDPMAELAALRQDFPMKRGEFWFAAGISFTCFSLVDAIAVISVKIGDGLEIALLGLARMALPRPQFPLVSIELALLARFSTSEGVLWIQAQLTDNSWLLYESVRLTGGFAFVTWFKGPNSGQFVLTLGGYHPQFHHDGYPDVPRLGFRWSVSDAIVIKGENYFALTSEALMAGGMLLASAHFGPAWAEVKFGADGIVYFDPFRFEVDVYASISAGVTIDVWIGEITISVSLGAKISVSGPKFHGRAEFDVGPVSLAVEFGDTDQSEKIFLTWDDFVRKYLEEAAPGVARVLTAIPGKGSLPPGTKAGGTTETGTADGSVDKPFEVYSEFEITVTTLVPTQFISVSGAAPAEFPPSMVLGVAPVNVPNANSALALDLLDSSSNPHLSALQMEVDTGGSFPVGVWGPPQDDTDRKVPAGEVINAVNSVSFEAIATLSGTLPRPVKYNQVETGTRKPLPFVTVEAFRPTFLASADNLSSLLPPAPDASTTFAVAKPWLRQGGYSRTALAALEAERTSPPRLGSLTQDLATSEMPQPDIELVEAVEPQPIDYGVHPPRAIAILSSPVMAEVPKAKTSVNTSQTVRRIPAPTMNDVKAQFPMAVSANLIKLTAPGTAQNGTVVTTGALPLTRIARSGGTAVASRSAPADAQSRLTAISASLGNTVALQRMPRARADAAPAAAQPLQAGEVLVLQMPNAKRDVPSSASRPLLIVNGSARVVAFSHGGHVLSDGTSAFNGVNIPRLTERIAILATGDNAVPTNGLAGWHSGQELAYVGWGTALAAKAMVRAEGARIRTTKQRYRAGWLHAAELVTGTTIVTTEFSEPVQTIAIFIDEPIGSDAAQGLALTLDGADRAVDQRGQPVPPIVVSVANRTVLIYSITRDDSSLQPVSVSIGSQDGWHLAGVLAGNDAPQLMAQRVAATGIDVLIAPLVPSRQGTVQISWVPQPTPGPGNSPTPRPALRRTAKHAREHKTTRESGTHKRAVKSHAEKKSKKKSKKKRKP